MFCSILAQLMPVNYCVLGPPQSICRGPWASSSSMSWELVRDAGPQALPHLLKQNPHFNQIPR